MSEKNEIFDLIISLTNGAKNEKNELKCSYDNEEYKLNACTYLLGQVLRQYSKNNGRIYISKKADEKWRSLTSGTNMVDYWYTKCVTCNGSAFENGEKQKLYLYKGNSNTPVEKEFSKGDKFSYREIFHDEHIIPIASIVEFKNNEIKAIKDMVATEVISIITKYHNTKAYTQLDFDIDHDNLCEGFINEFTALINQINDKIKEYNAKASSTNQIKNAKIDPKQITYGKAQKIANMTFKYLSLFDKAYEFDDVFSLCHIAIDSYIIDEIKSLVGSCGISTSGRSETLKKVWSNYDENDYENMLNLERQIIKSKSCTGGKILFFEEFEWWKKHL